MKHVVSVLKIVDKSVACLLIVEPGNLVLQSCTKNGDNELYQNDGDNEYTTNHASFKYKFFWHKQSFSRIFWLWIYISWYNDISLTILDTNISLTTVNEN